MLIALGVVVFAPLSSGMAIPANCPVGAPSFNVSHSQLTLGSELILECPYDPTNGGHPFVTRTYQITNNTASPWNSYHFRLELNDEQFVVGTFKWDPLTATLFPGGITTFSGRHADVDFLQPLLATQSFSIQLRYGSYNGGDAFIFGSPVPEPGSAAMVFIAGVVSWTIRRRLRQAAP